MTEHGYNSPELLNTVADAIAERNDGKVTAGQAKKALIAASGAGGLTALLYDIGLGGLTNAGGAFVLVAASLIGIVRLMWEPEDNN